MYIKTKQNKTVLTLIITTEIKLMVILLGKEDKKSNQIFLQASIRLYGSFIL